MAAPRSHAGGHGSGCAARGEPDAGRGREPPAGSRRGLMRTKWPTGSMLPVRSLGPPRSAWMTHLRPTTCSARRRLAAIRRQAVASSCAQLMRIRSMPARSRSSIRRASSAAALGIVTMMRTERSRGAGTEQPARVVAQQQAAGAEIDRRCGGSSAGTPAIASRLPITAFSAASAWDSSTPSEDSPSECRSCCRLADVGLADAQVVQQVAGAVAVVRLDGLEFGACADLEREGPVAQVAQRRQACAG